MLVGISWGKLLALTLLRKKACHGSSINVCRFTVTGKGRQDFATPKQPVAGESTGEGWQLGEDRGQLIYFDLNLQKRSNNRWTDTSDGRCTDFWACCFSYRAQSQDLATFSCNYSSHCQYKLMAQIAESGDQQIHAEYSTAAKHVKPLKSLMVTQMTRPNIY